MTARGDQNEWEIGGAGSIALQPGPVPLYYRIQSYLRAQIEGGRLEPGAPLPTEAKLCELFGVSRITVVKALDGLVSSGWIFRRRGVGSFVAEAAPLAKSVVLTGTIDQMLAPAKSLSRTVRGCRSVAPPEMVARTLGLAPATQVICFETLHLSAEEPFSFARLYFPEEIAPLVDEAAVTSTTPLIYGLAKALGRRVARAEQVVDPVSADRAVAGHLGIKPGTSILQIMRTYTVEGGRPVEAVLAWYHPDRYRYTINLVPTPQAD